MSKTLEDGLNEFYGRQADLVASDYRDIGKPWARPIVSDALKVHPSQVEAANERNKKHGCSVRYRPDGRPVIPDRNERRKLLKIEQVYDRDGFVGY